MPTAKVPCKKWVVPASGASNGVRVPFVARRKPRPTKFASTEYPVIAPAGLMLEGDMPFTAPGISNVVKVPLPARRKP
jgi:hypothetical protein